MSQMLQILKKAASSGPTKPSLLSRLSAIATVFGGAWLVFVTQSPAAVKGPIGSAVAIFVAVWINAEHSTARNTDAMAVAAMKSGTAAPAAADPLEMAQKLLLDMGVPSSAFFPPAASNGSTPTGVATGAPSEGAS